VLEGRSDLATIVGYDEWPAGVALENWHADPDFVKDLTKAKGFSKLLPLGADKAGPPLSVSLGGGPEHPIGSGRMLVREKSQVLVRGYSFKRPGSNILEYISLEGDLYADPVTGSRMFDERAASALSAARPLLKPAPRNRAWLYDKYLLPSVDGANLLTIPRAWLGADEVITVSPSLSMAAAQALGVDNYFTFELAVDGNAGLWKFLKARRSTGRRWSRRSRTCRTRRSVSASVRTSGASSKVKVGTRGSHDPAAVRSGTAAALCMVAGGSMAYGVVVRLRTIDYDDRASSASMSRYRISRGCRPRTL
jgi:hypothetical protein